MVEEFMQERKRKWNDRSLKRVLENWKKLKMRGLMNLHWDSRQQIMGGEKGGVSIRWKDMANWAQEDELNEQKEPEPDTTPI